MAILPVNATTGTEAEKYARARALSAGVSIKLEAQGGAQCGGSGGDKAGCIHICVFFAGLYGVAGLQGIQRLLRRLEERLLLSRGEIVKGGGKGDEKGSEALARPLHDRHGIVR